MATIYLAIKLISLIFKRNDFFVFDEQQQTYTNTNHLFIKINVSDFDSHEKLASAIYMKNQSNLNRIEVCHQRLFTLCGSINE